MVQHQHVHHIKKKKQKEPFDYLVYFFMIATPLFEIPQAYAIYSSQSSHSVSALTWIFFFLSSVVSLIYSIRHKLRPFIVMYWMYLVVEASIVVGIILYS